MIAVRERGADASVLVQIHGFSPQQIFTWRWQATSKLKKKETAAAEASFLMVGVDGVDGGGAVEIGIGAVSLRVGPTVPVACVKVILQAVRSA